MTVLGLSGVTVVASGLALFIDGRVPAAIPPDAPAYAPADLLAALSHLDSKGFVDVAALAADRAPLDRFIASMAAHSPASTPQQFPTAEDKVAYWLNAAHALVLQQLIDDPGAPDASRLSRWRSWPIGGERLTRAAIERRFLSQTGDGRVWLALFDGRSSGPLLDGALFGGDTLNPQLDDAARRYLRRPQGMTRRGSAVALTSRLTDHLDDFLAALPHGRSGVLQIVWAYLPATCEGLRPGCDTREDLDRACGPSLEGCQTTTLAPSDELAIVQR